MIASRIQIPTSATSGSPFSIDAGAQTFYVLENLSSINGVRARVAGSSAYMYIGPGLKGVISSDHTSAGTPNAVTAIECFVDNTYRFISMRDGQTPTKVPVTVEIRVD